MNRSSHSALDLCPEEAWFELRMGLSVFRTGYIYNLLTAIGLSPGGSGYFTCTLNMKLVTNKFMLGGLHEKHVVATWNLGNHLSILAIFLKILQRNASILPRLSQHIFLPNPFIISESSHQSTVCSSADSILNTYDTRWHNTKTGSQILTTVKTSKFM